MKLQRPIAAALALLASCGNGIEMQADPTGTWRVAECEGGEGAATLLRTLDQVAAVVLLHADAGLQVGIEGAHPTAPRIACHAGGLALGLPGWTQVVGIDGAEAAVDVALLACNGVAMPARLPLGSRTRTGATETVNHAPGDFLLQLLVTQHPNELSTTPTTDEVHRIGLLLPGSPSPTNEAWASGIAARAARYPQLELLVERTGPVPSHAAERLLQRGCRVLVAVPETADLAVAASKSQPEATAPAIVVLDPLLQGSVGTCTIGVDARGLGAAAAAAVKQLVPAGGNVVLVGAPGPQDDRREGFAAALGLRTP